MTAFAPPVSRRRAGLIALLCALAALAATASSAHASSKQQTIFEAPGQMLYDKSPTPTAQELKRLGADTVRLTMIWQNVAPNPTSSTPASGFVASNPATYKGGFARYDRAINAIRAQGMKVLLTISTPMPYWASKSNSSASRYPETKEFRDFVAASAKQFGSRVTYWSLINEGNQPRFLEPQFKSGRGYAGTLYRSLVFAGQKGFADAGIKPRLLIGETAPRGRSWAERPLAYLRDTFCLDSNYKRKKGCKQIKGIYGWAHHPYPQTEGPYFHSRQPDDLVLGDISRLSRALKRARSAKAIDKTPSIYVTEYGIQSYPDKSAGVSLQRQAEYNSISEYMAYKNSGVKSWSQYLMTDDPLLVTEDTKYGGFQTGVKLADGSIKPSYYAFRTPLAALRRSRRSSKVDLWGLVRPATGKTNVTVQYQAKGSSTWKKLKTQTTGSNGAFTTSTSYRSGRTYRLVSGGGFYVGPETRVYAKP